MHMDDVRAVCHQGHPGAERLIAKDKQGVWLELTQPPAHLHGEHNELVNVAKPLFELCGKRQPVKERLCGPFFSAVPTCVHALPDHPRKAGHALRIQEIWVNELDDFHG